MVDLGLLGPSFNCPADKSDEYMNIQIRGFSNIKNKSIITGDTPPLFRNYYFKSNGTLESRESYEDMIIFSFLMKNTFASLGNLQISN